MFFRRALTVDVVCAGAIQLTPNYIVQETLRKFQQIERLGSWRGARSSYAVVFLFAGEPSVASKKTVPPTSHRQSAAAHLYPVFLNVESSPVLVIGGGPVATRKVVSLLAAGASVTVIAPQVDSAIEQARGPHGKARIERRKYRLSDIRQTETDSRRRMTRRWNCAIADAARRAGIPINVAAPPEAGDFQVPSSIHRGIMCVAISTGGASAALAAAWREKLERLIGPEWSEWTALLEHFRPKIMRAIFQTNPLGERCYRSWVRCGNGARVKKLGVKKIRADIEVIDRQSRNVHRVITGIRGG